MTSPKDIEIMFIPGCFDEFEGTQAELDELISKITQMATDGTLFDNATIIDFEESDEFEIDSDDGRSIERTLQ